MTIPVESELWLFYYETHKKYRL